jgi:hypothetical protein
MYTHFAKPIHIRKTRIYMIEQKTWMIEILIASAKRFYAVSLQVGLVIPCPSLCLDAWGRGRIHSESRISMQTLIATLTCAPRFRLSNCADQIAAGEP